MSIPITKLDEALDGILEGMTHALKTAKALEGVETIVRGDSSRPAPRTPALWIRPLTGNCDQSQRSYAEKWTFDVLIIAIIKSDDPDKGYQEANRLAAKARTEILKDRSLGKRPYIQDVRSLRFDPSGPDTRNETLYAATATVQVHFIILEQNP